MRQDYKNDSERDPTSEGIETKPSCFNRRKH